MSNQLKERMSVISLVVGLIVTVLSFVQAYAVLPYRMDQVEKAQRNYMDDRDRLIRIETTLKNVERRIDRLLPFE